MPMVRTSELGDYGNHKCDLVIFGTFAIVAATEARLAWIAVQIGNLPISRAC